MLLPCCLHIFSGLKKGCIHGSFASLQRAHASGTIAKPQNKEGKMTGFFLGHHPLDALSCPYACLAGVSGMFGPSDESRCFSSSAPAAFC